MRWLRMLMIVGLFAVCTPGSTAMAAPAERDDPQDIEEFARQMRVPGIAARLVDADGPQWAAVTGSDGGGDEMTASTPFVWGSVSKSVAASVALGLAESGELTLDTPVREALPGGETWVDDDVVVRDLIHHTSGLPHDLSLTDVPRLQSAREVVANLAPPQHGSKGSFRYSSLNYLLLQAVIERVTGDDYAHVIAQRVGEPSSTRIVADTQEFAAQVPAGHVPWFGTPRASTPEADGAGFGYGYLAGSIESLGRYAQWLSESPRLRDRSATTVETSGDASYGPGLYHELIAGRDVWWHAGAVPGYFTHIALFPDTGQALVLAANRYGELESNEFADFARYLMRTAAGEQLTAPSVSTATKLPVIAAVAALAAILVGAVGVWRLSRRREPNTRRTTIAYGLAAAILYLAIGVAAWFAHLLVGVPSRVLSRWAPDLALVLTTLSAAAAVTALLMTVATLRSAAVTKRSITTPN